MNTLEQGTTDGSNGCDSARKSGIDYARILKPRAGSLLPNKLIYNADVHESD